MIKKQRLLLILLAFLSLIIGIIAGLVRIGWDISLANATAHHGAIMVGGFLGTLITLEKIIPLNIRWLYAVPVLSGVSTILFLLGYPVIAFGLLLLASLGLIIVFGIFFVREKSPVYALMSGGASFWLVGNIILLSTKFYPGAFSWWMCFVLFIIVAERLELMKFLPVPFWAKLVLYILLFLFAVGCGFSFHGFARILISVSLAGIAIWLMKYDIVGISLRRQGLTRFVAVSLISGYVCLLFTAVFLLLVSDAIFAYDMVVHTFFIGFVFSMIFAHGPIIIPGVIGIAFKPFTNGLYLFLLLLHSSLIIRIIGDIYLLADFRKDSGILSVAALLLYFFTLGYLIIRRRNQSIPS